MRRSAGLKFTVFPVGSIFFFLKRPENAGSEKAWPRLRSRGRSLRLSLVIVAGKMGGCARRDREIAGAGFAFLG